MKYTQHWNIGTWHIQLPEPISLKTYSELVSMANSEWYARTNTIAELNQYPSDYYDELNSGSHLTQVYISWGGYYDAIIWIEEETGMTWRYYMIVYSGANWSEAYVRA